MTRELWQRIKLAYQAARELPLERRAAELPQLCGGDSVVLAEVESLLAADREDGFVEPPTEAVGAPPLLADAVSLTGTRLGAYRIESLIGGGGMADVYRASRIDGEFEHEVAIKLIKPGMHAAGLLRRFRLERQTLARLNHPNIARMLDGGQAPDGRPYLVMELVEGVTLDRYCDDHRLSTRARLQLFEQVCQAVQFAHNNLVLHCDLKPANILVLADGTPKLLDFGVARVLSPDERVAMTLGTTPGRRFLTPEYASPEQVRGEPLTTASDVYALGLVLYQLLTGRQPYRFRSRTLPEIERTVCECAPQRPSTIVLRSIDSTSDEPTTETPESIGAARGVRPEMLSRLLFGDLDNIVLMALRKDPHERYASADSLRQDVVRHLTGMPVLARRPSFVYRASKFIRRNRLACAATIAIVASLAFGGAMTIWQARVAQRERDAARAQQIRAERTAEFLIDLFKVSDPDRSRGETVTARELLDRGAARIRTELHDQEDVRASLLRTMGLVYMSLGIPEPAVPLLAESAAITKRVNSAEYPRVLADLGGATVNTGDVAKGVDILRQALALTHAVGAVDELDVAEMKGSLGWALSRMGETGEAELLQRESLEIRLARLGEDNLGVAQTRSNLALLLLGRGEYEPAETLIRQALAAFERAKGAESVETIQMRHNLAFALHSRGEHAEALPIYESVLAARRRVLTDKHPSTIATMNNLGGMHIDLGNYAAAEPWFREALAASRELRGPNHFETAQMGSGLALALLKQHKFAEAEPLLRQALDTQRARLGPRSLPVSTTLLRLGELLMNADREDQAAEAIEESCSIRAEALPPTHKGRAECEALRGRLLLRTGRLVEAEPVLREAWAQLSRSVFGAARGEILADLIEVYSRLNRPDDVAPFRRLLETQPGATSAPSP